MNKGTNTMKKLILAVALVIGLSTSANAYILSDIEKNPKIKIKGLFAGMSFMALDDGWMDVTETSEYICTGSGYNKYVNNHNKWTQKTIEDVKVCESNAIIDILGTKGIVYGTFANSMIVPNENGFAGFTMIEISIPKIKEYINKEFVVDALQSKFPRFICDEDLDCVLKSKEQVVEVKDKLGTVDYIVIRMQLIQELETKKNNKNKELNDAKSDL